MSHALMGQRWIGFREEAWHGLGTVFQEPRHDVRECMQEAGILDFTIDECEVFVQYRGELMPAKDYKAIVRSETKDYPTPQVLGIGSDQFEPIQNERLAELVTPLAAKWPIETIGVIEEGGRTFITLDAGDSKIAGEQHRFFFLLCDGKRPGDGLNIAFTPVRVVCKNTLETGLAAAKINASVRHTIGVDLRVEGMIEIIGEMEDAEKRTVEIMNLTAKKSLVQSQIEEIFLAAYPDPVKPGILNMTEAAQSDEQKRKYTANSRRNYENLIKQTELYRVTVHDVYESVCDENPKIAGTGWAAYNAVVELQDWGSDRKNTAYSAIFKERAKPKGLAFNKALQLARG